jgi:hypothetical protein
LITSFLLLASISWIILPTDEFLNVSHVLEYKFLNTS